MIFNLQKYRGVWLSEKIIWIEKEINLREEYIANETSDADDNMTISNFIVYHTRLVFGDVTGVRRWSKIKYNSSILE